MILRLIQDYSCNLQDSSNTNYYSDRVDEILFRLHKYSLSSSTNRTIPLNNDNNWERSMQPLCKFYPQIGSIHSNVILGFVGKSGEYLVSYSQSGIYFYNLILAKSFIKIHSMMMKLSFYQNQLISLTRDLVEVMFIKNIPNFFICMNTYLQSFDTLGITVYFMKETIHFVTPIYNLSSGCIEKNIYPISSDTILFILNNAIQIHFFSISSKHSNHSFSKINDHYGNVEVLTNESFFKSSIISDIKQAESSNEASSISIIKISLEVSKLLEFIVNSKFTGGICREYELFIIGPMKCSSILSLVLSIILENNGKKVIMAMQLLCNPLRKEVAIHRYCDLSQFCNKLKFDPKQMKTNDKVKSVLYKMTEFYATESKRHCLFLQSHIRNIDIISNFDMIKFQQSKNFIHHPIVPVTIYNDELDTAPT